MKKALSTAIIATILIASSAWADTDTVTSSNNDSGEREMHQEHRQKREDQRELRLNMMKEAQ